MIYKAKKDSKAYAYIKDILEKEDMEREAYFDRVNKAVGFKVEYFSGYYPNKNLDRKYLMTEILVSEATWEQLDKKLWQKKGMVRGRVQIAPSKRIKRGKEIVSVLQSFHPVTSHWDILSDLGLPKPNLSCFSITQLFCNGNKDAYMLYVDDTIRADMENPDLIEITRTEYDKIMEE